MTVAVIMTVFNRLDKTKRCLNDLEIALENIDHTYFITNDGSTDGTTEYLKLLSDQSKLEITNGNGQLFWNRGMYVSFEKALCEEYDYYLWVNNDTTFYPNMWRLLIEDLSTASKDNEIVVICGAVRSEFGGVTYGGTNEKGIITPSGKITRCTHINGNCLLIPRSVASLIGNLDYRYEHGLGDFDYGQRIIAAGGVLYSSSDYVGTCEKNSINGTWKDVSLPIRVRIRKMKEKNGQPRESYKIYLRKWNKRTWLFYYYKPYIDICISRMKYLLKGR